MLIIRANLDEGNRRNEPYMKFLKEGIRGL